MTEDEARRKKQFAEDVEYLKKSNEERRMFAGDLPPHVMKAMELMAAFFLDERAMAVFRTLTETEQRFVLQAYESTLSTTAEFVDLIKIFMAKVKGGT